MNELLQTVANVDGDWRDRYDGPEVKMPSDLYGSSNGLFVICIFQLSYIVLVLILISISIL